MGKGRGKVAPRTRPRALGCVRQILRRHGRTRRRSGQPPEPPASTLWLSGDVHCSYVAQADLGELVPNNTALYQLTMSPFRNPLDLPIRVVNRLATRRPVVRFLHFLAHRAGLKDHPITWQAKAGPWFDNGVMLLRLEGETASVRVEHARTGPGGAQELLQTHEMALTP